MRNLLVVVRSAQRKVQPCRAKSDRKETRQPAGLGRHGSLAIFATVVVEAWETRQPFSGELFRFLLVPWDLLLPYSIPV